MILRFKQIPLGGEFVFVAHGIEHIGRRIRPVRVLSKDRNRFLRVNAPLIPREKWFHGSGGMLACIPRRHRVRLAA